MANLPGLPVGAAAGAAGDLFAPFVDALRKVGDAARAVVPFLDAFAGKLQQAGERLQQIGGTLVSALGGVGKALAAVAAVAPAVGAAVGLLGTVLSGIVSKANPAVAEQFSLALNDTLAVIGQALTPVLQVLTEMMRMFGDTLASFAGQLAGPLADILSSLIPIFEVFLEVFASVGQVVADVLKATAPLIRMVAEGIRTVFEWIGRAVKWLLSLVGIELNNPEIKKGASVGAAVRQASFGSVEDLIKKAQASALQLGAASGVNYAEKTATSTAKMEVKLGGIMTLVENIREIMKTEDDIRKLKADLAPGGYYDEQKKRLSAQRTLADLAVSMAGAPGFYKPMPGRAGTDGSGTVPPHGLGRH
jgi:phage-related protein